MSTPPEGSRPDDPYRAPPPVPAPPPGGDSPYGHPSSGGYQGPPAPYGAPPGTSPYGAPYGRPGAAGRNGLGTAALVLGITGLALSIFVVGAVFGILAIILGFVGRSRARRREASNGGAALAGIITGVLSVIVAVALVAVVVSLIRPEFSKFRDCLDGAQTGEQQTACQDLFRRSIEDRFSG